MSAMNPPPLVPGSKAVPWTSMAHQANSHSKKRAYSMNLTRSMHAGTPQRYTSSNPLEKQLGALVKVAMLQRLIACSYAGFYLDLYLLIKFNGATACVPLRERGPIVLREVLMDALSISPMAAQLLGSSLLSELMGAGAKSVLW